MSFEVGGQLGRSPEEWMQLFVSTLMLAGLNPCVVPLSRFGMPRRPWALIVFKLCTDLLGAAGPLSRGVGLGRWFETANVVAQTVIVAAFIGTAIWLRRRAKLHGAIPAGESRLADEALASDVEALLTARAFSSLSRSEE